MRKWILGMAAAVLAVALARDGADPPSTEAGLTAPATATPLAPPRPMPAPSHDREPGPASEPSTPPRESPTTPPVASPDASASPAPGRAFRAEHDNATAGLIAPVPPADAATWAARRVAIDAAWSTDVIEAARAFSRSEGLTEGEAAAVEEQLEHLHADLSVLRAEVTRGALPPATFREQAAARRLQTRASIEATLGPERTLSLLEHLAADTRGGGF